MGITEILRRIWLFSAKIKSSESFSNQPTQLIVKLNSSLRHIIVTKDRKHALTHFDSRHQDCNITRISGIFPSICVKIKYSQYFPFLCQELENVQDKKFEWKGFLRKQY